MSEWREYRLDEIGQVVGGGTPLSKVNTYWNGDVGWITPADLSGYQFKHIGSGSRDITELGLKKSSAKLHPKNTVLMTSRAPIGYLAIADKPVATNQGFQSIRCNEDVADFNFIYYLLGAYKEGIALIASGATFPEVSSSKVRQYKISLPPLPTQQKIAKILSNYDDLIENNLKRIKLLEESARLTYEEWFLRFRIDGKKLDIDPESDLPFGWEKKSLGDCVNNYDNQRRPLSRLIREDRSGDYPYYGAASVLDHIDDFIFDGKYLLVGEDGTVQTKEGVPMLQFINCKFWVSNHAHILTGKNISTEFLYLALNVYPISNHITGAAQPKINQQNLNRIPMVIANEDLRAGFDKIILPIFKQIFNLKNQNQLLKEARDILLPRLMTNVIDTDDLDIAV
jgi:type I restriction enzyme, S subunit